METRRSLIRSIPVLLALTFALSATSSGSVSGNVVVARSGAAALVLWDASSAVGGMLKNKRSSGDIMRALESQAMTILSGKARQFGHSKTIEVRTIYARTGAVSPVYGNPDYVGFEKLFSVSTSTRAAMQHGGQYAAALSRGKVPSGVTLRVTGKLPPH